MLTTGTTAQSFKGPILDRYEYSFELSNYDLRNPRAQKIVNLRLYISTRVRFAIYRME